MMSTSTIAFIVTLAAAAALFVAPSASASQESMPAVCFDHLTSNPGPSNLASAGVLEYGYEAYAWTTLTGGVGVYIC